METLAEIIWQGVDQYTVAEIKGNIWNAPDDNHYLTSLPETIYLSPVLNAYLQKLSESVFSKIRYLEEVRIQIRYQPFSWFPHTTLGKRLNQAEMREAFVVMQNQFAQVKRLRLGLRGRIHTGIYVR